MFAIILRANRVDNCKVNIYFSIYCCIYIYIYVALYICYVYICIYNITRLSGANCSVAGGGGWSLLYKTSVSLKMTFVKLCL